MGRVSLRNIDKLTRDVPQRPKNMAEDVVFRLVSDYIIGEALSVDGGLTV